MKTFALILIAAAGCATARPAPLDREAEAAYHEAVVAGLTNRPSKLGPVDPNRVDYARLRRARELSWSLAHAAVVAPLTQALDAARAAGDQPRLLNAAHAVLEQDFTDVGAHLEKARALHDRDARAASFHETIARGLLASILTSGDGDTPESPLLVFGPREIDAVLAFLDVSVHQSSPVRAAADASAPVEKVTAYERRRLVAHTLYFEISSAR